MGDYGSMNLTTGKSYDVIDVIDAWYWIRDDKGRHRSFHMDNFKLLSDIREEKLNQVL